MIEIDRSASLPVPDQLAEQLRFLIANGHYKVNQLLPPTRKLADQIGISFHTVRKAYQKLVEEGILEVQQGSGYKVTTRTPLSNEERLERGATIVQKALQQLVSLGLDEGEIEYMFEEQLDLLNLGADNLKLVFVASYPEMAQECSEQIRAQLQLDVETANLKEIDFIQDADFIFCPTSLLKELNESLPRIDKMGISSYLSPEALDRIARLFSHETLGLVTFHAQSIPHLMNEIQHQTGFDGQVLGASLEDGSAHISQLTQGADMLVYTPLCRRRILPFLKSEKPSHMVSHIVSEQSMSAIQQRIPSL